MYYVYIYTQGCMQSDKHTVYNATVSVAHLHNRLFTKINIRCAERAPLLTATQQRDSHNSRETPGFLEASVTHCTCAQCLAHMCNACPLHMGTMTMCHNHCVLCGCGVELLTASGDKTLGSTSVRFPFKLPQIRTPCHFVFSTSVVLLAPLMAQHTILRMHAATPFKESNKRVKFQPHCGAPSRGHSEWGVQKWGGVVWLFW